MFDLSFSKLVIIALVALIVIGPERLPRVARAAGQFISRLQRYISSVKADINREMQMEDLKKLQKEVAEQAESMKAAMREQAKAIETALEEVRASADDKAAVADAAEPEPVPLPAAHVPDGLDKT